MGGGFGGDSCVVVFAMFSILLLYFHSSLSCDPPFPPHLPWLVTSVKFDILVALSQTSHDLTTPSIRCTISPFLYLLRSSRSFLTLLSFPFSMSSRSMHICSVGSIYAFHFSLWIPLLPSSLVLFPPISPEIKQKVRCTCIFIQVGIPFFNATVFYMPCPDDRCTVVTKFKSAHRRHMFTETALPTSR